MMLTNVNAMKIDSLLNETINQMDYRPYDMNFEQFTYLESYTQGTFCNASNYYRSTTIQF